MSRAGNIDVAPGRERGQARPHHVQAHLVRPRLGFAGVGWIGRHRLDAIAQSGVADIAAIADPDPHALAAAGAVVPGARQLRSFDGLLALPLDGVVIATPSALHAGQAIAALEQGMAVFCQKPLARTGAETRQVVAAARAVDRLLGVDFCYRHTEAMTRVRDAIGAGAIGEVYAVNLVFHNAYGPDKPWFYDRALSGGGCLVDLGSHLVDLALWTLGFPAVTDLRSCLLCQGRPLAASGHGDPGGQHEGCGDRVADGERGAHDDRSVEDYAAVQMELAGGAVVQMSCSWRLPAGCDAIIEASFYGTGGGIGMRNVDGSFYDFTAERFTGTRRTLLAGPPDDWGGRAAVAWARQLAGGMRFDAAVERAVDVAAVLDAIYRMSGRSQPSGQRSRPRSRKAAGDAYPEALMDALMDDPDGEGRASLRS